MIPGLEQGLLGMKVRSYPWCAFEVCADPVVVYQAGEERQLFVPSRLGYGARCERIRIL